MHSDLPRPAVGLQTATPTNSTTLFDALPDELNYPLPRLPFAAVWESYADAGLSPIPVLDAPPAGFQKWTHSQAERWVNDGERWAYAQTAIVPGDGFVILDDDYPEQVATLEASLGSRPATLYSTSRGPGADRRKRLYRVPAGSRFTGEYDGGEVIDSRHRFAFVCPTVNRRTGEVEQWYAPDDSPLERFPTADDLRSLVSELPAAWVQHLSRNASQSAAHRPYDGPTRFLGGSLSPSVQAVADRHPDTSHYPEANSALYELAYIAARFPESEGIETLRSTITEAYIMRTDTRKPVAERQASMDRAWRSSLATQTAKHEDDWAELEREFGTASVEWSHSRGAQSPAAAPQDNRTAYERAWSGDLSGYAEERAQRALDAPEPERSSWAPLDLSDVLGPDYTPPMPSVFERTDGRALFYAAKVNEIHGTDGDGKTMVALAAVAETLIDGGRVLYLDHEESPSVIVSRLRLFGVPLDVIREHLHYVQPEGSPSAADLATLEAEGYALVVIDTVNESIATLTGGDSNNSDDITRWHSIIRPFARSGACVLVIDHITKDAANPLYPIGSQAKRAGYKGLVYLLKAPKDGGLIEGGRGYLKLILAKGNSGGLGIKRGALAAEFHLDSTGAVATWELRAPDQSSQLAEMSAEIEADRVRIVTALTDTGGSVQSKTELWSLLDLKVNGAPWAQTALAMLIQDGFVKRTKGRNGGIGLTLVSNLAPTPEADAENDYPDEVPDSTYLPSPLSVRGEGEVGLSEANDLHDPHEMKVDEGREGLRSIYTGVSDAELVALLEDDNTPEPAPEPDTTKKGN